MTAFTLPAIKRTTVTRTTIKRTTITLGLIAPLALAATAMAAPENVVSNASSNVPSNVVEAPDEEFPVSELRGGKRTTRTECEATRDAVWVAHRLGTECIRFFPSANVQGAKVAVLYFHGDQLDGTRVLGYTNNRASVLRKDSELLARVNRVPYILVARPGTFGSSGWHNDRRGEKEYLTINAAVGAIKQRYGLENIHIGGQSGGAATVGALLTMGRTDIVCAAASSGPFDALGRARDIADRIGKGWNGCDVTGQCGIYNVTDHVDGVAAGPGRRIFIIGDPQDGNTEFRFQAAFAEKLKARGHDVTLIQGQGLGPMKHNLLRLSNRALGWCNAGLPSDKIAELVAGDAPALGNDKQHLAQQPVGTLVRQATEGGPEQ